MILLRSSSAYASMSRWKPSTHSHTESLEEFTGREDILVTCVEKLYSKLLTDSYNFCILYEKFLPLDTTSESASPLSPMGSTSSVKSSYMSSTSSLSQDKRAVVSSLNQQKMPSPSQPKFCHNCGQEFPITTASFCCHCGIARLTINRGQTHVK